MAQFAQKRCTNMGSIVNGDVVAGAAVLQSGLIKIKNKYLQAIELDEWCH